MFDLKHALKKHSCLSTSAVCGLRWSIACFLPLLGLKIIFFFFFLLFLKIHIQRTEGCDHMTCSQCNTNFCYRCGERYRQLRFFGDHTSNLSIFGCKYRYLPERPHLRRLVRGSVCGEWINALCRERHKEVTEAGGVSVS